MNPSMRIVAVLGPRVVDDVEQIGAGEVGLLGTSLVDRQRDLCHDLHDLGMHGLAGVRAAGTECSRVPAWCRVSAAAICEPPVRTARR